MARRDFDEFPGARDPAVRELVERTIPWHLRAALADLLKMYDVKISERWPRHPVLGPFLERAAAAVLRDRGVLSSGMSETAALRAACKRLRLNPQAVRKHFQRARRGYLKSGTDCPEIARKAV